MKRKHSRVSSGAANAAPPPAVATPAHPADRADAATPPPVPVAIPVAVPPPAPGATAIASAPAMIGGTRGLVAGEPGTVTVGAASPAPPRATSPEPVSAAPAEVPSEGRMRRAMTYATEAVIALGLAFVFFGIFLAMLGVFFPTGIQLRELVAARRPSVTETAVAATSAPVEVARLSVLRNDVRSKPAGAVAWGAAAARLPLHDRDAIQTLSSGRGLVTFNDGDQIHLEKNSLIIISARSGASAEAGEEDAPSVVMVDGEMWGRLRLEAHEKMNVTLPGGAIHLAAGPTSGAEFRVAVQGDKSSTISVYRGEASISAKGRTVKLSANQGTRVTAAGEVTAARDLPGAPRLQTPADGTELRYGEFAPQVLFQWDRVPDAGRYRIVVARDREMRDVLIDRTVERTEFLAARMTRGRYFWRVASLREDLEGAPTEWRRLETTNFGEPPRLAVDEVPKVVESSACVLRGRTRPGSRVIVAGEPVRVSADGSFEHTLSLDPGANVLTVEAIDAEGNASYWTKVVHGKF